MPAGLRPHSGCPATDSGACAWGAVCEGPAWLTGGVQGAWVPPVSVGKVQGGTDSRHPGEGSVDTPVRDKGVCMCPACACDHGSACVSSPEQGR